VSPDNRDIRRLRAQQEEAVRRLHTDPITPEEVWPLLRAIEQKDVSTGAHTWRVVLYARLLAETIGMDRDGVDRVGLAAALHDVGKIDIPDRILKKPGKLTPDEFRVIQTHTTAGHQRLIDMGVSDEVVLHLVRHHHERLDGTGYPDKLTGTDLRLGARAFAVIDTFDAMTSIRPYRSEVGPQAAERALREIESHMDDWYCADCVRVFADLYREGRLGWIMEHFNDKSDIPAFFPEHTGEAG
jgi:HD-GYP domain-containing protein (c-di-GMP phosphodiesterase class II)